MTLAISPVCPGNPRIIPQPQTWFIRLIQKGLRHLTFRELKVEMNNDNHNHLDLLWECKQLILPNSPLWAGLMDAAFGESETLCKTSVVPMIDLPPTDFTCVYSTLKYISFLAQMYHKRQVCTFDQALWWRSFAGFDISEMQYPIFYYSSWRVPYQNEFSWLTVASEAL